MFEWNRPGCGDLRVEVSGLDRFEDDSRVDSLPVAALRFWAMVRFAAGVTGLEP